MLLLNDTLKMHIDKKVAGFISHDCVTRLDRDRPKRLYTEQVLEVHDVDDFKRARLRNMVDVAMLRIHVQKEHLEAAEALDAQLGAFELLLVAHDLIENIGSAPLIQQILAFTANCRVILFRQEVKEDFLLIVCRVLGNHSLEQRGNVHE